MAVATTSSLHSQAVIPVMIDQGGGAIVSTASISGLIGLPAQAAYCASKGAMTGTIFSVDGGFTAQ